VAKGHSQLRAGEMTTESGPQLAALAEPHAPGPYERFAKPVIDRAAGALLSILTLPVVGAIVLAIWRSMGRPAVFHQERIGRSGTPFTVYKFRTMQPDRRNVGRRIEHAERRQNHKAHDDPRHTTLGRFLRKWSLDELPQFWNLAKGEMSLVGPRPELPEIVARYAGWQHRRHEVRPGLTGLWQVTSRGDVPMHEATDLDIEYVDNITFVGDLKILLKTPAAVLGSRKGH